MAALTYHRPRVYGVGGGGQTAPALTVDGQYFRNHGARWTGIQCSEFSLAKRYMQGEDVRPLLDERVSIGFNMLRVWLLNESVVGQVSPGGIHPNQYPDFYERVRDLTELLGTYGLVVEYTAFTSCVPLMTNRNDQVRHWGSVQSAVRGLPNAILELVNEYDWGHGENAPHRDLWSMRPSGIIASSGSSTADAPPPQPVWDYVLHHTNGLNEWQRRVGHNTMEMADHFRCPGGANENMRYPDHDSSDVHAFDAAAGAALLCAFACYHSQAGKYSRPFDATERRCAEAWVSGARSVDLEVQPGRYQRHDDMNVGGVIRAYSRTLPDGRSDLVKIRA